MAVVHNTQKQRFEIVIDSWTAELNYALHESTIIFLHTGVPAALEGRGIGSQLAAAGLKYARDNKLKVDSRCSFIDHYMQRHPDE